MVHAPLDCTSLNPYMEGNPCLHTVSFLSLWALATPLRHQLSSQGPSIPVRHVSVRSDFGEGTRSAVR